MRLPAASCTPTQTLPALQAADLQPQLVAMGLTCQASAAPDTILVAYTVPGRPARHKSLPDRRPLNPIFASKFASHPNRALPPVLRRRKPGTPARSRSNTDGVRYGAQWQSRDAYEHGSYARDADENGDSNREETGAYDDVNADNYASHFAPRYADVYPQQRRVYDRGSNDHNNDTGDESRERDKYDYSPYANGTSGLYGNPYNPSYTNGYYPNPPPDETARAYRENSANRLNPANGRESDGGFENFYFNFLAEHEGGYTASDGNGSPANFGIKQGANPDIDVSKLTPDEAKQILHDRYWIASGADQLPAALAAVHGDTAVNMGVDAANELLAQSGGDPQIYLALREERYRSIAASKFR